MLQKVNFGNASVSQLLECDLVAPTIDVNSSSIDLKEHDGCLFIVGVGESNDTLSGSVKIELEVETSDDDSTWADAADADISSSVTGTNTGTFGVIDGAADDAAVYTTAYVGRERYARVVVNVTGTHTNGTPYYIAVIRTRDKYA